MQAEFRSVLLREVIQQAITIVEPEFSDAGIEIITHLDRQAGPALFDPHLIRQMILNLMNNALRAMPDGGKLYISSKFDGKSMRIVMRDTGQGISPEDQEKIFEPFFTTHSSGTGLGLVIVQKIVKRHLGSIIVKSKPGTGTTFLITLPYVPYEKSRLSGGSEGEREPGAGTL